MTATIAHVTETDEVLAAMFTENTGRHMLDSGGAYGRNWERNQGRAVDSFLEAPTVTLDVRWDYLDVTLDAFHWLRDKLEFAPDMQRKFELYVALRNDEYAPWLVEIEEFATAHRRKYGEGYLDGTVNTYNGESCLSQVLQYTVFNFDGESYMALQVHGGCDVRGGYTAPKMFRVLEVESLYDESYTLHCDREPPQADVLPGLEVSRYVEEQHYVDYRSGELTDKDGCYGDPWHERGLEIIYKPDEDDHDTWFVRCPYCEEPRPMTVSTWY